MLENIRLSFRGIWSHKMRSILTMLGIIIGIASIISIVSTIQGTNEQLLKNMVGAGTNAVKISLTQDTSDNIISFDWSAVPDGVQPLLEEDREKLLSVSHVEDATLYLQRSTSEGVYYGKKAFSSAKVFGIDQHYFNVNGLVIRTGRAFLDEDYEQNRKVVILDQTAASALFQESNPLGQVIEMKGEPFCVIGVVQPASKFVPTMNSVEDYYTYMGEDTAGTIFLPSTAWPIVYAYDEPQNVAVKASSVSDMATVGKPCAEMLNTCIQPVDSNTKYRAQNVMETVEQQQKINASTNQQLIWIASISLLVGGIGVMNIMLVSVTERTNEIGLKKAIGARKSKILSQFLTEAAVLTSMGGILGVISGIGMAQGISHFTGSPVGINIPAIIISVLFSMMIGLIFGFVPSIKAGNLDPIEALRHE